MSRPIPAERFNYPSSEPWPDGWGLYQHWNDHLLQCEQHVPLRTLIWSADRRPSSAGGRMWPHFAAIAVHACPGIFDDAGEVRNLMGAACRSLPNHAGESDDFF
jgi:hypothetical protein